MINSTYRPTHSSQYESDKMSFDGKSVRGVVNESSASSFDIALTDDMLLTGGEMICIGAKWGDSVTLQIAHPLVGVVNQFVTNYVMKTNTEEQFLLNLEYPAKLQAGLIIRMVINTSSEVGERKVACNYFTHKILL